MVLVENQDEETTSRSDSSLSALPATNPQANLALAGINADTLSKYLYSFNSDGREVVDVTADGINHIAQPAGVSTNDVEILEENDEFIMVKATAINRDGVQHIGIVREYQKNKQGYPNPFALQNAVSKAQRNAKKGLLPMTFVRDLIKEATGWDADTRRTGGQTGERKGRVSRSKRRNRRSSGKNS